MAARPWDERRPQAVWRGSARIYHNESACVGVGQDWRSHPRGELVAISERVRELVDAGFTSVGPRKPNGKPVDPGLARHQRPPLSFAECAGYRYAIEVDGSGYQASLAAKLLSGSTVLAQESRFPLWFSALLRDGQLLLDPTREEESLVSTGFTVLVDADAAFAGLHKPGGAPLDDDLLARATQAARERAPQLRAALAAST